MLEDLKKLVCEENLKLVKYGLVVLTWGNVSAIDREKGLVVIKPSGVDYSTMKPEDMVVVDMDGKVVEGSYRPSSDLPTHLVLYKNFPNVGGVVHTHSTFATSYAQSGKAIEAFGTTHADNFHGAIPCTRKLTEKEINEAYEENTGNVIVETVNKLGIDYEAVPAILIKNHGPFTWGPTPSKAVETALVLENVAKMAVMTKQINRFAKPADKYLLDKHYFRKHGKNAYYGQGEHK